MTGNPPTCPQGWFVVLAALGFADDNSYPRKNPFPDFPACPVRGRYAAILTKPCHSQCKPQNNVSHVTVHRGTGPTRRVAKKLHSGVLRESPRGLPGDLFWFLTKGELRAGVPSWSRLPEAQRWQIVSYLKSLRQFPLAPTTAPQK
ncbi:MAG TPA: hypothetical protein VOA41_06930 [Candidatus Dormibacteraeota bacterium]|nr:hypothetical protein [Candidatus Dormibacteraeota bacterium]